MKNEIPMGVSQWRNHGRKFGYEAYFFSMFMQVPKLDHHCECEDEHFVSIKRKDYDDLMKKLAMEYEVSDR